MPDIDALSDGGFCEMGTYPGIQISDRPGVPEELASTLRHLNLKEVERRRRLLSNNTRYFFLHPPLIAWKLICLFLRVLVKSSLIKDIIKDRFSNPSGVNTQQSIKGFICFV